MLILIFYFIKQNLQRSENLVSMSLVTYLDRISLLSSTLNSNKMMKSEIYKATNCAYSKA